MPTTGAKDFVVKPFQPDRVIEAWARRSARPSSTFVRKAARWRASVVLGPADAAGGHFGHGRLIRLHAALHFAGEPCTGMARIAL
jgi:hypothetical protein